MNPDEYTVAEHMLDVGHGHTLYIQDWGNKKAKKPIIFLHGGPGSQCKDKHKLPFDPKTQRVIFFDQRGSGKSLPAGRWHHNDTQELAGDISKIADFLKLDRFILTGSSWGSTLALYYALQTPERIEALVIGGVWTSTKAENDWLGNGLYKAHFPDVWARYQASVPESHQSDPSAYHFDKVLHGTPEEAAASGRIYGDLEASLMSLDDNFLPSSPVDYDPAGITIEMRYVAKGCFMPERFILDNAHKLTMPLYVIQGRYDFVCPPITAYELSQTAPDAHLVWVTSGHRSEHETLTAFRLIYAQLTEG